MMVIFTCWLHKGVWWHFKQKCIKLSVAWTQQEQNSPTTHFQISDGKLQLSVANGCWWQCEMFHCMLWVWSKVVVFCSCQVFCWGCLVFLVVPKEEVFIAMAMLGFQTDGISNLLEIGVSLAACSVSKRKHFNHSTWFVISLCIVCQKTQKIWFDLFLGATKRSFWHAQLLVVFMLLKWIDFQIRLKVFAFQNFTLLWGKNKLFEFLLLCFKKSPQQSWGRLFVLLAAAVDILTVVIHCPGQTAAFLTKGEASVSL